MRAAPMSTPIEVCKTSRSALADQMERTYFGIRRSFLRSLVDQHRVGPVRHIFCRAPARRTSPCKGTSSTWPSIQYSVMAPCTRRDTSSLLQAFSPPSSKGCSSGGHFLFLLLLVLSRSYSLYFGEPFLLWALYSSLSL